MSAIIIIITSIVFSSTSQILLKLWAWSVLFDWKLMDIAKSIILNPFIIWWIWMQVVALLLWIVALKKVDVSFAYPFISLGFILVLVVWHFFLHETIDIYRFIGIATILVWIIILSLSHA